MNYYEILGIEPDSFPAEVEKSYQKLMSKYLTRDVPDLQFDLDIESIEQAYKILIDPVLRKNYDKTIKNKDKTYQKRLWETERKPIEFHTPYKKGDPVDWSEPNEYTKTNSIAIKVKSSIASIVFAVVFIFIIKSLFGFPIDTIFSNAILISSWIIGPFIWNAAHKNYGFPLVVRFPVILFIHFLIYFLYSRGFHRSGQITPTMTPLLFAIIIIIFTDFLWYKFSKYYDY